MGSRLVGSRGAVQAPLVVGAVALTAVGALTGAGLRSLDDSGSSYDPQPRATTVVAYDCPGGTAVGELHSGDRIFATARHEDAPDWLRVRDPLDPDAEWWIEAHTVDADTDTGDLAVATCASGADPSGETDEVAAGDTTTSSDTTVPGSTSTPTQPGQTQPLPPGGTIAPPPAPAPDVTGPSLSLSVSPSEIWELDGGGISCGLRPRQATLTATTSDPSGVPSVTATWTVGNLNENKTLAGAGSNRTTTVGSYGYHTIASNTQTSITVSVTATDGAGNQTAKTTSFVLHSTDQCFG